MLRTGDSVGCGEIEKGTEGEESGEVGAAHGKYVYVCVHTCMSVWLLVCHCGHLSLRLSVSCSDCLKRGNQGLRQSWSHGSCALPMPSSRPAGWAGVT